MQMRQGEESKETYIDVIECDEIQEKLDPLRKIKTK